MTIPNRPEMFEKSRKAVPLPSASRTERVESDDSHASNGTICRGNQHKTSWTPEQDAALLRIVDLNGGTGRWRIVAERLQKEIGVTGRAAKHCRERYFNHLDPNINRADWTPEENRILANAYAKFGTAWSKISKLLPGRTDNAIKNRWYCQARKKARKISKHGNVYEQDEDHLMSSSSSSESSSSATTRKRTYHHVTLPQLVQLVGKETKRVQELVDSEDEDEDDDDEEREQQHQQQEFLQMIPTAPAPVLIASPPPRVKTEILNRQDSFLFSLPRVASALVMSIYPGESFYWRNNNSSSSSAGPAMSVTSSAASLGLAQPYGSCHDLFAMLDATSY